MKFDCPHCSQPIECEDDMAGTAVACPACQRNITIPAPDRPTPRPSSLGTRAHDRKPQKHSSGARKNILWAAGTVVVAVLVVMDDSKIRKDLRRQEQTTRDAEAQLEAERARARELEDRLAAQAKDSDPQSVREQDEHLEADLKKVIAFPNEYQGKILKSKASLRGECGYGLRWGEVGAVAPLFTTDALCELWAENKEMSVKLHRIAQAVGTYGEIVITYKIRSTEPYLLVTLVDVDLP